MSDYRPVSSVIDRLDQRPRRLRALQRQFLGHDVRSRSTCGQGCLGLGQPPLAFLACRSASGITSFASTVQRSGVTSAKPPATNSLSVTRSPSYSAIDAAAQHDDHRRVAFQHAHVAFGRRDHHHVHRPRQQQLLRADDFQVHWHGGVLKSTVEGVDRPCATPRPPREGVCSCRLAFAFRLSPFFTASSIVPTM